MMSPPSGYSSGETDAPFANPALLESVRSEVDTMKRVDEGNCDLITASVDGFLDSNVVGAENSASGNLLKLSNNVTVFSISTCVFHPGSTVECKKTLFISVVQLRKPKKFPSWGMTA